MKAILLSEAVWLQFATQIFGRYTRNLRYIRSSVNELENMFTFASVQVQAAV